MRRRPAPKSPKGSAASAVLTWTVFVAALLLAAYVFAGAFRRTAVAREGIVIIGNPVIVASWDRQDDSFSLFRIPQDVSVDAVHGYGTYTLGSLWKLDGQEKRHGELYTRTLEAQLGFPIRWFIDPSVQYSAFQADTLNDFKSVFTPDRLFSVMPTGRTSMSAWDYIALHRAVSSVKPDKVTIFDIEQLLVLYPDTLKDGSSIRRIDAPRLDALVANGIEDRRIRQEALRLAIFNTTGGVGLGQKFARTLNFLGMFVVYVGNKTPEAGKCTVRGTKEMLETVTARNVAELFGCVKAPWTGALRADLEVDIGTEYAKRYDAAP